MQKTMNKLFEKLVNSEPELKIENVVKYNREIEKFFLRGLISKKELKENLINIDIIL